MFALVAFSCALLVLRCVLCCVICWSIFIVVVTALIAGLWRRVYWVMVAAAGCRYAILRPMREMCCVRLCGRMGSFCPCCR